MPKRVDMPFPLPRTGHYGSEEHYRLEGCRRKYGRDARLSESSPRGFRLAEAIGAEHYSDGWLLTPARAGKWVELFEAGVDCDADGFFVYADGGRYDRLTVLQVVRDLRRDVA